MTIDEAIAHAREVAKMKMAEYENHYDKDGHYYPRQCKRYAKQQEQLAEWLEELKELRNMTAGHLYAVAFKNGYLKAEKEVRNNAIDDFAENIRLYYSLKQEMGYVATTYEDLINYILELAEQLKEREAK